MLLLLESITLGFRVRQAEQLATSGYMSTESSLASVHRAAAARVMGCIVLLLVGCTSGTDTRTGDSRVADVADSAGIRLITLPSGTSDELPAATLVGQIDRSPRDSNPELHGLRSAAFSPRGELLVVQASTAEVLLFDATLAFVGSAGRRGGGPGEYGLPVSAWALSDGGFAVYDFRQRKLAYLDAGGVSRGEVAFDRVLPFDSLLSFVGVLSVAQDGAVLAARQVAEARTLGIRRPRIRRALLVGDSVRTLATETLGPERHLGPPDERGFSPMGLSPFAQKPVVAMCGEHIIDAASHTFALMYSDRDGAIRQIVREERPRVPLEDRHIKLTLEAQLPPGESVTQVMIDEVRRMSAETTLPVIDVLLCDSSASLWVVEAATPGAAWRAVTRIGADGKRDGRWKVPASVRFWAAAPDRLAGLGADPSTGAERVEVWQVPR